MKRSRRIAAKSSSKVKIDWIEIPGGEFIFGLKTTQTKGLLQKLSESFETKGQAIPVRLQKFLDRET
jgi:hypothetical protein